MDKYIFDESNGLWYELQGDYYIPCLILSEEETQPIGLWGQRHKQYLKEHKQFLYTTMLIEGTLNSYLADIDRQAQERLNRRVFPAYKQMKTCDYRQEENVMELILKAKDIRVEFKGRDVLDIDNLEVYDYDRIGLVGANGAGKSTLFKVLLGELTPLGCKMNRLGELAYIPQLDEVTLQEEKDFALVGKLGVKQLDMRLWMALYLCDGTRSVFCCRC